MSRYAIPIGVVAIIIMLVIPLPAVLLDVLIVANIGAGLLVLLVSMQVRRAIDFAVFPALLLVLTLFRLALNVSSTRLVLLDGFAGKVIEAFGGFVVGGSLVVGLVIFSILVVIQFMVITNGAGRVAEVGARFTLDAMPGKQMAIDADLNSGLIDEEEARRRRAEITAEADFYGAMDGASKFVKGDAVASIIITLVNLVGGFAVGMAQKGMTAGEAISTYSLLTVGDGLVSQIPALLLSVATGIIVTRSTSDGGGMGGDIVRQLGRQQHAVRLGGGAVLALVLVPGLPKLPFLLVGGAVLLASTRLVDEDDERTRAQTLEARAAAELPGAPAPDSPEGLLQQMRVDPIELQLAPDLLELVDTTAGGDLLDRVRGLRRKVALETGLVLPLVRTRDNLDLPLSTYAVLLNGVEVARGEAPPGTVLAIGEALDSLPGRRTQEPVFGLPASWVPFELRHQAEMLGATVVDRASVLTTHLAEVVRTHAAQLLGREDVRLLTEVVKRTHPSVVEELTPAALSMGEVQRVLQSLLEEQVAIRDLVRIFEAMSLRARTSTDHEGLVESVRATLGGALAQPYVVDGRLPVLTLDPRLEQALLESVRQSEQGSVLLVDAHRLDLMLNEVARALTAAEQTGRSPVLVCSPQIRPALRRLLRPSIPRVVVLGYGEVGDTAAIDTIGVITDAYAPAA